MALSFGENLGVLGNIKITDVKLVAGAFRTVASGSDTGSITVQRVEDGQIVYIQSEDRLIKASKSGATVNWSNFTFPTSGSSVQGASGTFDTITVGGGTFTSASLAGGGVSSYGDLADIPAGIVSASSLGSSAQGQVTLTTNNVAGSVIDLGLQSTDSPTFQNLTLTGDLTAENYIVSSSVTFMTQSFSSGSTIFGDSLDDTHKFTGSLNVTGSITATTLSGDGSGLTNVFEGTTASQSISLRLSTEEANVDALQTDSGSFSTRITNATSSIAGLKTDSGSFSTRLTTEEANVDALQVDSGSFSTRVTDVKTRITTEEANVDALQVDSGSFSTRLTTEEANVDALQVDSGSFSTRITNFSTGNVNLVSGSSVSTGSFGRIQTFGGIVIDNGNVSGSTTSTGSFGRIEVGANTISIGGTEIGKTVADNLTDLDQEVNTTSSPTFAGITLTGNIQTSGDIIAERYIVSSSVSHITSSFSSGSTIFGDTKDDTHQFTGSLFSSGSVTAPSFTGTFIGALSSSAQISSDISGSLGPNATLIRSLTATGISGSFTSVSSSISTRLTTEESNVDALQVDSGSFSTRTTTLETTMVSEQTNIDNLQSDSGSFSTRITNATSSIAGLKTDSGSFSTRTTTLESTMTAEQTNIDTLESKVGQSLNVSDSPTFQALTLNGDLIAENFIVSSSVTHMTQSFSSGSTIFGDTLNDTHLFTGSLNITGSVSALSYSGIFNGALSSSAQISSDISGSLGSNATLIRSLTSTGISGSFTETSSSFSTSITNATSSISGLKTDSGSFSTRVTSLENTTGGIFVATGSSQNTTNDLQVTGSLTLTNTGSFGVLLQNSEIVASPTNFNTNQTSALETDENGDIQFVDSNFTSSKFLIDGEFEMDNEGNFQQKIKLEDYFGSS